MSKARRLLLTIACLFYVLTIIGFFYFDLAQIVSLFLLFTLSITYFAYRGYRDHNDYTGAEHLQQEIGILKAEKEKMAVDYEALEKKKDKEIKDLRQYGETLSTSLSNTEKERNALKKEVEKAALDADKNKLSEIENILPTVSEGDEREDAARANLMQLYEYARSFDNRNDKSLYDFLEYIDQLIRYTDAYSEKTKICYQRYNQYVERFAALTRRTKNYLKLKRFVDSTYITTFLILDFINTDLVVDCKINIKEISSQLKRKII